VTELEDAQRAGVALLERVLPGVVRARALLVEVDAVLGVTAIADRLCLDDAAPHVAPVYPNRPGRDDDAVADVRPGQVDVAVTEDEAVGDVAVVAAHALVAQHNTFVEVKVSLNRPAADQEGIAGIAGRLDTGSQDTLLVDVVLRVHSSQEG